MATTEHNGLLTHVDASGNKYLLYPITKAENVDGFSESVETILTKASPRNLLDNSDFRNPVNQRGQTSYTTDGYCIDRWFIRPLLKTGYSLSVEDGFIKLLAGVGTGPLAIAQRFPKGYLDLTKTYTLAYMKTDGEIVIETNPLVTGSSDFDYAQILVNSVSLNIVWVALYEGEYTKETLPEYRPKGYAVEKLECQRYYVQFALNQSGNTIPMMAVTATQAYGFIPLPTRLRVTPTITARGAFLRQGSTDIVTTSIAISGGCFETGIIISVTVESGLTKGAFYTFRISSGSLSLSADL